MTMWTPDVGPRRGPRYLAIADALAEDAGSGRLPPGLYILRMVVDGRPLGQARMAFLE